MNAVTPSPVSKATRGKDVETNSGCKFCKPRFSRRRVRAGAHHHRRLDDVDGAIRTVRLSVAALHRSTGIGVKVVAVGTGQALDIGRRGDADVVFVHDKVAEEKFLAEGFGVKRFDVMYNDFVVIGPKADPAHIAGGKDVAEALRKIAADKTAFVSRGDRSGTHEAELRLWKVAGVDLAAVKGDWYREIGQGMGAALNMASSANAYLISDRGTWLAFKNRGDLAILTEGDRRLFNQYGVMLVNPAKHRGREGQGRPGLRRLADFAGGTKDHCRLQGRRRAAIFYQRDQLAGTPRY